MAVICSPLCGCSFLYFVLFSHLLIEGLANVFESVAYALWGFLIMLCKPGSENILGCLFLKHRLSILLNEQCVLKCNSGKSTSCGLHGDN